MKIVVLVNIVPDVSVMKFDVDACTFDPNDLVYAINPSDMAALEAALCIRERIGSGKVTCISIANPSMEKLLRRCIAMGADEAVMLWGHNFDGSDCIDTATILTAAIKKIGYDVILCGTESSDTVNPVVGPAIAGMLDIPNVNDVTSLKIKSGMEKVEVHRALEKGEREVLECSLPALFTAHPSLAVPRYPTFDSSMEAIKSEIPTWDFEQLNLSEEQAGLRGSPIRLSGFSLPRPRPRVTLRVDSNLSAAKRMKILLEGGVENEKTQIWEGEPRELAAKIIQLIDSGQMTLLWGSAHFSERGRKSRGFSRAMSVDS